MTTRTPMGISQGDRVSVALLGRNLEPNGRHDFGTVYRLTPAGAVDVHFDDDSYAVVAAWQVEAL